MDVNSNEKEYFEKCCLIKKIKLSLLRIKIRKTIALFLSPLSIYISFIFKDTQANANLALSEGKLPDGTIVIITDD